VRATTERARTSPRLPSLLSSRTSSTMGRTKQTARKSYGGRAPRPAPKKPAPTLNAAKAAVVRGKRSEPARSAAPEPQPKPEPASDELTEPMPPAASSSTSTAAPARRFVPGRSAAPEPEIKTEDEIKPEDEVKLEPVDEVAASIKAVKDARAAAQAAKAAAKSGDEDEQVKDEE